MVYYPWIIKIIFIKKLLSKDLKGILESLDNMLSTSIDIKKIDI